MNTPRFTTVLFPLLLAGFGLTGCTAMLIGDGQASGGANGQGGISSGRAAETGSTRSIGDAEVTEAVRSRLLADTSVEATGIDVTTAAGRVTLSGIVTSFAERDRAGRLAAAVPGVVGVDNRLAVQARR
ncbi:BON domain-containing protein [Lentisalinibacter orientalis]|uniref:BON domain-containing protein n=1 Tax=Lentisalinibacter orientalis TaxID=2992241 RepID=UPI00386CABC1